MFAARAWRYWKRNGQYWTVQKAANAALAHLALRLKLQYVPAGPVVAKMEATNMCNGTCRLCPVGRKEPGHRPFGRMSWGTYCGLIDQLKDSLLTVDLTNWGESLLHPRILDMVRYAHDARIYTYLSTNLHTVKDEQIDGLMQCGLDELALSLHGLSERTYRAYQPGFSLDEACRVIGRLVQARRRFARQDKLKIKVNFVVTAVNEHEIDQLPAFAERYGVDYQFGEASLNLRFKVSPDDVRARPHRAREVFREIIDEWLPRSGRHDRQLYRKALANPSLMYHARKVFPCDWPWTKLVVNCDGGLSICCGSYHAADDLARYVGQPIRRLWNSPSYRRCRATFGRRAARGAVAELCGRCPGLLL